MLINKSQQIDQKMSKYKNIDETFKQYQRCLFIYWWLRSGKKRKILIVFDNTIADMLNIKIRERIVTELVIELLL